MMDEILPLEEIKKIRIHDLAKPEFFSISISGSEVFWRLFTEEEKVRLKYKLGLVADYACQMCAGMVKGTIKYSSDTISLDEYTRRLVEVGVTEANYTLLLQDAWRKANAPMWEGSGETVTLSNAKGEV